MLTVGVRELRQRASELLRRVELGETIQITDRGRPVAVLAPVPGGAPLDRLKAEGEVIAATAVIQRLPPALVLAPGQTSASQHLSRLRRDER